MECIKPHFNKIVIHQQYLFRITVSHLIRDKTSPLHLAATSVKAKLLNRISFMNDKIEFFLGNPGTDYSNAAKSLFGLFLLANVLLI